MQRGAVPPLITMLGQTDVQLKEMGAFALGRLAQNADNQAGIVQVPPFRQLAHRPYMIDVILHMLRIRSSAIYKQLLMLKLCCIR